jgi:hypothetical protein
LSKARFVVWWSDVGKKLVPGLYCPDIVTALYALAMWSSGTAGGWAICQKCGVYTCAAELSSVTAPQKCQVAAAMQRYREISKDSGGKSRVQDEKEETRKERNSHVTVSLSRQQGLDDGFSLSWAAHPGEHRDTLQDAEPVKIEDKRGGTGRGRSGH